MEATEGLETFVEIVEQGSLAAASRTLDLPRSTLSRQLSRLEERMGVRLLHRTTRRTVLTRAGEELFARARRIVEDARAAVEAVRLHDDVPRGLLRVTVPPTNDDFLAKPLLAFAAKYPEIQLEVNASARRVDLVREGFDVAIRGRSAEPDGDLVSRVLVRTDAFAVASPAYLDRRGRPATVEDLAGHDLILGVDAVEATERRWALRDGGSIAVRGRLVANDMHLRARAAVAGFGIALLAQNASLPYLLDHALEPVLASTLGYRGAAWIVYPERAFLQPKVRVFVDHCVEWAKALPPAPAGCPPAD